MAKVFGSNPFAGGFWIQIASLIIQALAMVSLSWSWSWSLSWSWSWWLWLWLLLLLLSLSVVVVVCCLLSVVGVGVGVVVCCRPSVVRCPLSVVRCPLSVVRCGCGCGCGCGCCCLTCFNGPHPTQPAHPLATAGVGIEPATWTGRSPDSLGIFGHTLELQVPSKKVSGMRATRRI